MAGNTNGHMESGIDDNGKRWVAVFIDDPDQYVREIKPGDRSQKVSSTMAYYTNSDGKNVKVQLNAYIVIPSHLRI